jgi:hypothetical protein
MTSKVLQTLVHGTLVIVFWSVSVKAGFSQSAAPYLSFKFSGENDQRGKSPQSPAILKERSAWTFRFSM